MTFFGLFAHDLSRPPFTLTSGIKKKETKSAAFGSEREGKKTWPVICFFIALSSNHTHGRVRQKRLGWVAAAAAAFRIIKRKETKERASRMTGK